VGEWPLAFSISDINGDGSPDLLVGDEGTNTLYAFDGKSGSLLWKFKTGDLIWSPPAIGDIDGDGKLEVVFGSWDNYLYALNGEDGSLLWKFETKDYVVSSSAKGILTAIVNLKLFSVLMIKTSTSLTEQTET